MCILVPSNNLRGELCRNEVDEWSHEGTSVAWPLVREHRA